MEVGSPASLRPDLGDVAELIPKPVPGLEVQPKGRVGILVRREARPSATWLNDQDDPRWQFNAESPWWAFMPLDGGLMLVPEPLLVVRGRATRDEVLFAVDHANQSARVTLAELFPEVVSSLFHAR